MFTERDLANACVMVARDGHIAWSKLSRDITCRRACPHREPYICPPYWIITIGPSRSKDGHRGIRDLRRVVHVHPD